MTTYAINSSNSVATTDGSTAFPGTISPPPLSTLEVANGGYIRAEDGGDGADLVDFTAAGVTGLIEADGSSNDGINNSVSKKNSSLALTVSSTGTIYGGLTGVYSTQVDLITTPGRSKAAVPLEAVLPEFSRLIPDTICWLTLLQAR